MVNWLRFKYSWAPFLGALVWLGTLIALLVLWLVDGPPDYKQNRTIIYISYAGAKWKGLFVAGTVVTAIFYIITLILDVELRRHERIPSFLRRRESVFAVFSIITGTIAALCLALLAIFDVHNHNSAHWIFTVLFIVGVFLNALFNLFEIKYLARSHFQLGYLRRNAIAKLVLGATGLVFAIVFGVLNGSCSDGDDPLDRSCDAVESTAAVFEWIIALIFVGFLLTYVVDFRAVEEPPVALQVIEQQLEQQQQQVGQAGEGGREMQVNEPKPEDHVARSDPQIGSAVA